MKLKQPNFISDMIARVNKMEIFICEDCNTLATIEKNENTITLNKCECMTLEWKE